MVEGSSMKVNVHSKLTQVSSRPVGPGKTHPLTPLDHAMGSHSLHVIYYYKKKAYDSFDLSPLRTSLAEVLSMYPPVTGRFTRDESGNWVINCNDAGTRIYLAKVGTTLDEWLRSADGSQEKYLSSWDGMPEDPNTWSPFQIQMNEFEDDSMAIGISCSHMHVDPTCITLLIKSWAEIYREECVLNPPSFQPSAFSSIHAKSTNYYKTKAESIAPNVKMATRSFRFSCPIMKKCLSQCHAKSLDHATPFDFLAALFWTSIIRLKAPTQGHAQPISICIDSRKLLSPTVLSPDYFGNAIHFSTLLASEKDIEQGGLEGVVELVHKHVSGIKEEEFWSVIDWFDSRKDECGKLPSPFRMYGPELTFVSMEHMIFPDETMDGVHRSFPYSAVFENGEKPFHVSYHVGNVEGEGMILVMPSAEGGLARTVTVTLPEEEMGKLCQDQAILNLKPITLFGGTS